MLLDPRTGQIYTPNTNQYAAMGENAPVPLTSDDVGGNIDTEERANKNHVPAGVPTGGQFASKAQQALYDAIESGQVSTKLNKDRQAKHKKGSEVYKKALADGEFPSYTELSNMEVQKIVNENMWKGKSFIEPDGQFKTILELDNDFGIFVDLDTGKEIPTNKGTIHYSKSGAHLVPCAPTSYYERKM